MKKWIRWQGLAVFVVILVVIAFTWLVLVDWIARRAIETAGTKAVGAKVDVAEADVTLFPAGLVIKGVEVTDPNQPMSNAISLNRLHAAIELPPLLRRKIIVNDLSIEGLEFNTARRTSGALPGKKKAGDKAEQPSIPPWLTELCGAKPAVQFSIPKAEDILGREPLQTVQQADALRAKIADVETEWQTRLKELPSQKVLET